MVISDTLSCLSSHQTPDTKETVPGLNVTIHEISVFSNTDSTSIEQIQAETQNDTDLQTLLQYIMKGFPATSTECNKSVKPYFNYCDELTVIDGLMLKGNCIVIPTKLRSSCCLHPFVYSSIMSWQMGLSNANDIFEQCLRDIQHDLPGVLNIADDILVFGETYEEFKDSVLRFLDHCRKRSTPKC